MRMFCRAKNLSGMEHDEHDEQDTSKRFLVNEERVGRTGRLCDKDLQ